jgi:hypothetical protein
MAATKSQGSYFGLFLAGGALLCGGAAFFSSGIGKVLLLAGAAVTALAFVGFRRIKPLEGSTPHEVGPGTMKWIGVGLALGGWGITIGGMHFVTGNGGRIALALLGIGVSMFGILYVLPAAFNKTAFWKAGSPSRTALTPIAGKTTIETGFAPPPHAMESAR